MKQTSVVLVLPSLNRAHRSSAYGRLLVRCLSLIDDHVLAQQCKHALDAPMPQGKEETQLLSSKEQNVWLVVDIKDMHPQSQEMLKLAKMSVQCSLW